ncbi:MAG: type II secretion system F family protein [Armatimonadetes bacterium]|nr:type II secretion system F family protein [Armatimonadota bacterium]
MELLLAVIVITSFLTIFLLVIGLRGRTESELVRKRLREFHSGGEPEVDVLDRELQKSFRERVIWPMINKIIGAVIRMTPSGAAAVTQSKLDAAGNPANLGVREFFGVRLFGASMALVVGLLVFFFTRPIMSLGMSLAAAILFLVIIGIMPDYILQVKVNARQVSIRKSLPDISDLLLVSVEAGLSFDAAMQRVVEKVKGPLSDEFARILQELRLGKLRAQALRDMAKRTGVEDISIFVAAIYQADQLGVSVARVLRVQGQTLRNRRVQRIREVAAKLPVKMLFPLIFFILPAIFLVILVPGMLSIMQALGGMGR